MTKLEQLRLKYQRLIEQLDEAWEKYDNWEEYKKNTNLIYKKLHPISRELHMTETNFDILPRINPWDSWLNAPAGNHTVNGLTGAGQFVDAPTKYIPSGIQVPVVDLPTLWANPLPVLQ